MKKFIYLGIFIAVAVIYSCSKDEISISEKSNTIEEISESEDLELQMKLKNNSKNPNNQQAASRDLGLGDSNGNIAGGNSDGPPTDPHLTFLITYDASVNEIEKSVIRLPFQTAGTLLYYQQCDTDAQSELWYMPTDTDYCLEHNSVGHDCSLPFLTGDKDNPPLRNTPMSEITFADSCPQ